MLLSVVTGLLIGWILLCLLGSNNKPGIVYKIKWILAYAFILAKKWRLKPTFKFQMNFKDITKCGIRAPEESWLKESPRPLTSDINAADTIGFWGVDNHGNALVTQLTRRHGRRVDVVIYMKLASGEEYQLPIQPDVRVYNTNGKSFSAGGLTYELLEPLRRWRVSFNGLLRKGTRKDWNDSNDDVLAVRFNFIWHPMYSYMAMPDDINSELLATTVADMKWTTHFFKTCNIFSEEWYEQVGELHGTVNIEEKDEFELLLRGQKDRRNGTQDWSTTACRLSVKGILKNGMAFHVYGDEDAFGLKNFFHGHVIPASNLCVYSMKKCSLNINQTVNENDSQDVYFHFQADKSDYLLLAKKTHFGYNAYVGDNWESEIETTLISLKLNGKNGFGIIEYKRPHNSTCPVPREVSLPLLVEPDITHSEKLIVFFTERECQSSKLVGGKGASLALLTSLTNGQVHEFTVPNGFCVTNTSFNQHLVQNTKVSDQIQKLENVAWKRKEGMIQDECNRVLEVMLATKLSAKLMKSLQEYMDKVVNRSVEEPRFAVRSSAIGEDSEELSAAGQNETYLGMTGIHDIESAIIKCWASQFSFRSVEYKRQHGQLLNGGMGVVIQVMVPSDTAGVLFTHDPQTGSPAYLAITSNYGLGESVVSAAADPDTIILKRAWNDKLTVHNKTIGKKNIKIVMSESGGTTESGIQAEESTFCTLTDDMALQLGKIAILLEKHFGSARDIEWAIHNGIVYMLQSRPVTSEAVLTDFEVLHEFDGASKSDDERYTTANVQEVLPGAATPLTLTGSMRGIQMTFLKMFLMYKHIFFRYDPTVIEGMITFYNHAMFDRIQQIAWNLEEKKSNMTRATELGLFGRILDDNDAVQVAHERFGKQPLLSRLTTNFVLVYPGMFFGKMMLNSAEKNFREYEIPMENTMTPGEALDIIEKHMTDTDDISTTHSCISLASTVWNLIPLNMLSKKTGEFDMDHYADFAALIGSCNGTESGGIPFGLQELAHTIAQEIDPHTFSTMPPQNALKWVNEGSGMASKKFQKFLKNHGHRGYMEFEMQTVTWGMDPIKLAILMQTMVKSLTPVMKEKKATSIESALSKMNTPITGLKRKLLVFVFNLSRTFVCYREQSKSLMIYYEHCLRKSYRHLAKLLVEFGFLPDPELLFFFTHEELKQLIETRSPRLIMRAKRRHRQHAYMNSMHFPEMIYGYPKPIDETIIQQSLDGVMYVKGYPACSGVAQGTARVIKSFKEVVNIKPGDILITYATDIGWSPYFPMLSGVVTEIGGLISHGAVVAREYGLPCLIAAENATNIFTTGETVRLDAAKGILHKVE